MNWNNKLQNHFKNKRRRLLKGIKSAEKTRDNAPSAMESASDTTRNENEKLVFVLRDELKKMDDVLITMPTKIVVRGKESKIKEWHRVNITLEKESIKIYLVPEGLGGEVIDGVRLISSSSPLGRTLLDKKVKDKFVFNKQKGVITSVE